MGRIADAVLSGVAAAKRALGDDAPAITLIKKSKKKYIPGSNQRYEETTDTGQAVITAYDSREVDGTMIQAIDLKTIMFPLDGGAIPETNDEFTLVGKTFRVIRNQPIYAGSEIALHVVQARPVA